MLNKTKTKSTTVAAKNRSNSMFLGARRFSFLTKRKEKFGFNFLKINRGTLQSFPTEFGTCKVVFTSRSTGRKAHAFGATFHDAYQKMVKLFYVKYPA